jgi:hypothetical protein
VPPTPCGNSAPGKLRAVKRPFQAIDRHDVLTKASLPMLGVKWPFQHSQEMLGFRYLLTYRRS